MPFPIQRDETPTHIWNPDTEDFIQQMADDDNVPHQYTARAQEITTFPKYIADHVARHLAQHLVLKRQIETNYEDEFQKMMKEIVVEI